MEEKKEEIKPVNVPENPLNVLDRAESLAKRIEDANKKTEELVKRQEDAAARMMFTGKADAGQAKQEVELTPQEYSRKILNGEINPWIQKN